VFERPKINISKLEGQFKKKTFKRIENIFYYFYFKYYKITH